MPRERDPRALTLWPEWCPAFAGVRFTDGTPSELDKPWENRPMAPWETIAPRPDSEQPKPGRWFALHAGAHIGGKPRNEGALGTVIETAKLAGWRASVIPVGRDGSALLTKGERATILHPDLIVRSAIVALVRVTAVQEPGEGSEADWRFLKQHGWRLEVRPLPTPVPCKGAQGLWRVPEDIAARVRAGAP